jgi:putative ABC transport system substrate-binding protein
VRRRDFIKVVASSAAAWPLTARAQTERRIGVLMSYVESDTTAHQWTKAFSQSLQEAGWVNEQNMKLEYRWAGPNPDVLQANAAELVHMRPHVLVAGATPALVALQREARDIPIVFANVADPVGQGFVASLAHPGGNITGFGAFDFSMGGKWVQTMKEIAPSTSQIAVIFNPATAPFYRLFLSFIDEAARLIGVRQIDTPVHDVSDIARTLAQFAKEPNVGLVVVPSALFTTAREAIVVTVAQLRLPAIYPYSYFAKIGGLLSYGFEVRDMYRRAGGYVDRILKGAKPADLPVQQPTKFELVINLKTAKALGLTVPAPLLAAADEVID